MSISPHETLHEELHPYADIMTLAARISKLCVCIKILHSLSSAETIEAVELPAALLS
jgi:hypothetical protein